MFFGFAALAGLMEAFPFEDVAINRGTFCGGISFTGATDNVIVLFLHLPVVHKNLYHASNK